ncbi:MAG TPA: hypothetical protein VF470_05635, partial [Sphingomicrobium sp.]
MPGLIRTPPRPSARRRWLARCVGFALAASAGVAVSASPETPDAATRAPVALPAQFADFDAF